MTTMSGWWRRACSIDSSTVPASATTWKPGPPIEQRDEALPDDLVVVDDEQPERSARRFGCSVHRHDHVRRSGPAPGSGTTMIRVPCAGRALDLAASPPIASARARMLRQAVVAGPTGRRRDRSRRRRRRSTSIGRRRASDRSVDDEVPGPRVARRVAQRLADEVQQLGAVLRRRGPGPPSDRGRRRRRRGCRSGTARRARRCPAANVGAVERLRPQAVDEVADLADREVGAIRSRRRRGPRPRPATSAIMLGTSSSDRRHGVERLDDPVVEVAADPVALLGRPRGGGLLVEPGVVDGDPGVEREELDEPLVGRRELRRARPCRSGRSCRPTDPRDVIGTPRNDVIGGWFGGKPELSGWAAMFGIRYERASRMIRPSRPRPCGSGPIACALVRRRSRS